MWAKKIKYEVEEKWRNWNVGEDRWRSEQKELRRMKTKNGVKFIEKS